MISSSNLRVSPLFCNQRRRILPGYSYIPARVSSATTQVAIHHANVASEQWAYWVWSLRFTYDCVDSLRGWHGVHINSGGLTFYFIYLIIYLSHRDAPSMLQEMTSMVTRTPVNAGCLFTQWNPLWEFNICRLFQNWLYYLQLLSVISLLSSDTPNLDSPANVDAAKEVRKDLAGQSYPKSSVDRPKTLPWNTAYKKKVRRLVRQSAESY